MAYGKNIQIIQPIVETASSGGSLTLVYNSKTFQRITGTSNHTVVLPDATTCVDSASNLVPVRYEIANRSTGTVTVNLFGGSLAATLATNTQRTFYLIDKSTSAGTWVVTNESGTVVGIVTADSIGIMSALAKGNYQDTYTLAKTFKINPQEVGANYWITKVSTTIARTYVTGGSLNGYGYNLGGYTGSVLSTFEQNDADNNYCIARQNLTTAVYLAPNFTLNSKLYAVGGSTTGSITSTVYSYDDSANTWSARANYSGGVTEAAACAVNGYGYVAGGYNSASAALSAVNTYSDTANAWYTKQSLPVAKTFGCQMAPVLSDAAYAIGGVASGPTYYNTTHKFDVAANSWSTLSTTISQNKDYFGTVAAQDAMYAFGGYSNTIGNPGVNVNEEFRSTVGVWITKTPMGTARWGHSSFNAAGLAYAANGSNGTNMATVEAYKNYSFASLGVFRKSSSVPTSIYAATAVNDLVTSLPIQVRTNGDSWKTWMSNGDNALKTGETISKKFTHQGLCYAMAGGIDSSGTGNTRNESYSETANVWTNRQAISNATGTAGGFALSGAGYVVGGWSASTVVQSLVQAYTDILNSWTSKQVLPSARIGCNGFVIDGLGYATGGYNGSSAITTVDRYSESTDTWTNMSSLNTARFVHGAWANGGFGWVAEGHPTALSSYERYNPSTNVWSAMGNSTVARRGVGSNILGDYAYLVSGRDGGGTLLTTVERFDPATASFLSWQNINTASEGPQVSSFAGNLYVINGYINPSPSNITQQLNPESGATTNKANTNVATAWATTPPTGSYRKYEVRVGIPAYVAGVGSGAWVTRANLNSNNSIHGGFTLNGYAIKIMYSTPAERYSDAANTWTQIGTRTQNDSSNGTGFSIGGVGYSISGYNGSSTRASNKLDDATWTWSAITNQTTGTFIHGGSSLSGYGYTFAGSTGVSAVNSNQQYNPTTNAWANKAVVPSTDQNGSYNLDSVEGYMYYQSGTSSSVFRRYLDTADAWTTATSPTWPGNSYEYHTGTAFGGNLAVVGGYLAGTSHMHFNPLASVWVTRPAMTNSSYSGASFNLNGTILQAGGYNSSDVNYNQSQQFMPSINNIALGFALKVSE